MIFVPTRAPRTSVSALVAVILPVAATYAGRGQNGQGSRSGGTKGAGFEGGQTPLAMRLPKLPGFRNPRRIEFAPVNVSASRLSSRTARSSTVLRSRLPASSRASSSPVKVLGNGDLTKKFTVKVDKVSASAKAKIEAAGGRGRAPVLTGLKNAFTNQGAARQDHFHYRHARAVPYRCARSRARHPPSRRCWAFSSLPAIPSPAAPWRF